MFIVVNQFEMSLVFRDWLEDGVIINSLVNCYLGYVFGILEYCMMNNV